MNDNIQSKKSFFRCFWWLWLILLLMIIVVFIIFINNDLDKKGLSEQYAINDKDLSDVVIMTSDQIKKAELALNKGIIIEDAPNDYYKISGTPVRDEDGRFDNYNPYPLPYTDIKSVSIGVDNEYVFFKFQFYGMFPKKMPSYNDDGIECIEAKVEDFGSSADSDVEPYELHDYVVYGSYIEGNFKEVVPQLDHYAFISTDTKMRGHTRAGMVGRGMGYDYILSAYPLSFFNLKLGDEVTFKAMSETSSAKYHHQCIDAAGTSFNTKSGIRVKYKLGSDKYEIIEVPDKHQ